MKGLPGSAGRAAADSRKVLPSGNPAVPAGFGASAEAPAWMDCFYPSHPSVRRERRSRFSFVFRNGEGVVRAFIARRHFHRPPSQTVYVHLGPGMGVVVVNAVLVEAVFGKGRPVDFILSHSQAHGVAGGNAGGPEKHDGGGSKGGAVALSAFREEVGNEIFPLRRSAGASGIAVIFSKETADILYPLPFSERDFTGGRGPRAARPSFTESGMAR